MTSVRFHRLATTEFARARQWYAQRSQRAASRFEKPVEDAVARIGTDPTAHAILCDEFRSVIARRFPYEPVYEIAEDGNVPILAVAHASRKPLYWLGRA